MNDNVLNQISEHIWDTLNCIKNENKSKKEQLNLIKSIILKVQVESREIGRTQILNHLQGEIDNLKQS